jgi:CheY-like chemotaxis protein
MPGETIYPSARGGGGTSPEHAHLLHAPQSDRGRALHERVSLAERGDGALSEPPLRVLIVEDERPLSELIALALLEEGYEVTTAPNGAVALERVQAYRPDVILLDVQMPVMDGPTFAERYRQLPGPHAPIVVFTAAGAAHRLAARMRAVACLDKPVDLWALSSLLRRCALGASLRAAAEP